MLMNLLATATDYENIGLGETSLYALIGFIVVFLGIAFLILVVWGVGQFFAKLNGVPTQKKVETPKQVTPTPAPVTATAENEVDEEIVAVITAALMAYYQTAQPNCGFVVRRIKKI